MYEFETIFVQICPQNIKDAQRQEIPIFKQCATGIKCMFITRHSRYLIQFTAVWSCKLHQPMFFNCYGVN